MTSIKKLIIIGGPTASGKTKLAISLAEHYNTVILNCDSRQFYQEITIGTAKPSKDELSKVKHFFINHLSIHQEYNVGDFEKDAIDLLNQLFEEYDKVIMVGGSGLYIRAVCDGLDVFPSVSLSLRNAIEKELKEYGLDALLSELKEGDPTYYEQVDKANAVRVIRAIAVIRVSGQPYSNFLNQKKVKRGFECVNISTAIEREVLYQRINQRVDIMLEEGLLEEVKSVQAYKNLQALQTVGYQELFAFLAGELNFEEAIELIKRNTRRYAKRQMTWFRNQGDWAKFDPEDFYSIIEHIENRI